MRALKRSGLSTEEIAKRAEMSTSLRERMELGASLYPYPQFLEYGPNAVDDILSGNFEGVYVWCLRNHSADITGGFARDMKAKIAEGRRLMKATKIVMPHEVPPSDRPLR